MSAIYYEQEYNQYSSMVETSPSMYDPQRRKPVRADSCRTSNGTISTNLSTSTRATSAATHITQPPCCSKKIVVVGDGGCGKTCLLISYSQGIFPDKYVPTVFENYFTNTIHPATGKTVELALWDTAGQEEYDRLRPLSYPETDILLVCFAIDCPNSLENVVDKWYPEVTHFCPGIPLVLVGTKSDLRNNKACIELLRTQGLNPVTQEQGTHVASQMGAAYVECSSKERIGVQELFDLAVDMTMEAEEDIPQASYPDAFRGAKAAKKKSVKKRSCKIL